MRGLGRPRREARGEAEDRCEQCDAAEARSHCEIDGYKDQGRELRKGRLVISS